MTHQSDKNLLNTKNNRWNQYIVIGDTIRIQYVVDIKVRFLIDYS